MPPKPPRFSDLLHIRGRELAKGDPVAPPIVPASMYHLPGDPDGSAAYGRSDNPTWEAAEHALEYLEQAPCRLFPSGMAAIAAPLFCFARAGGKVLLPSDGYYTTRLLAEGFLAKLGVTIIQRPTRAFAEGGFEDVGLVFMETPSNPGLDLCDIAQIARDVRAAGGITVVDNTTMTPLGQRPLDLGADVVVASDTKAPSGHSDILMGHVACRDAGMMERITQWRKFSGTIPGPHEAWLLHRSLETLEVRFARMCESAGAIAARLAELMPGKVTYPGLAGHPQNDLAQRQMSATGFLIGIELSSRQAAEDFINGCPVLRPATSFGGTHSSAERRSRWGDDVAEGFVRLSVGCEPEDELWAAIEAALRSASG